MLLATSPANPAPASENAERRRHPRKRLDQLAYIGFGPDNGGVLLDIGEEGLRCQIVGSVVPGDRCHVKFSLPGQRLPLKADAEVAWANGTRQGGGIRFTKISPETRRHLRAWLRDENSGTHVRRAAPVPIRKMSAAVAASPLHSSAEPLQPVPIASKSGVPARGRSSIAASISAAKKLAARQSLLPKAPLTLSVMDAGTPMLVKIAILIVCLLVAVAAFASTGLDASQWLSLLTKAIPSEVSFELEQLKARIPTSASTSSGTSSLSSSSIDSIN
jgi:hypothetical protein